MRSLKVVFHIAALASLLVIAVSAPALPQNTEDAASPSLASFPAISLPPLYVGGEGFNSTSFAENDVTLVNFFASWCLPCRIEHPYLVDLAGRGVPVIGIDYMDEAGAAIEYLQSVGDPYQRIGVDPGTAFDATLQVNDIPQTFVVNRQGDILFRYVGRLQQPVLEQTIFPLVLAGASAGTEPAPIVSGSFTMSGMVIALIILMGSALLLVIALRREQAAEKRSTLKMASIAGLVLPALYIAVILTGEQAKSPPVDMEETYTVLNDLLEKAEAMPVAPPPGDMSMEGVTERLRERLQNNPGDIAGWTLLARSYASIGQIDKAIEAYEVAINHDPDNMDLLVGYGEMLVGAARGEVTEDARSAFSEVVGQQPGHPAAEYYLALADLQAGDTQIAYDRWLRLAEAGAETNAPWLAAVQQQLDHAAAGLGKEAEQFFVAEAAPAVSEAAPPELPAHASADNAETPAPDSEFIRSMVARLAARLEEEPNDLDGWLQLARSYGVLGEWKEAAGAYDHAAALAPENPEILALRDEARARAGT